MKKTCFVSLIAILIFSCQEPAPKRSILQVSYNENVETLALIYNLSDAGDYQYGGNPVPRAMLSRILTERFSDFQDHAAVQQLNQLLDAGFVDLYDILFGLYHQPLPDFEQYAAYPSIYYEHDSLDAQGVQAVFDHFNKTVKQFYQDADLASFFSEEGNEMYRHLLTEIKLVLPDASYISLMEDYYGIERNEYHLIVSAFSFNGIGKSVLINTPNKNAVYQFLSSNPKEESPDIQFENIESYKIGYTSADYVRELAIHELGHTFYECLRENKSLIEQINSLDYLFTDTLETSMRNQGYQDWRTCFEEHLVRLGEVNISILMGEQDFANTYRTYCMEERGFIYLDTFQKLMKEYEQNRDQYANIEAFIPDLIKALHEKMPPSK